MQKRAPTLANVLVIVLFALSCFGLLLFLWESFGGPVPLKPKGYRITVAFPRTLALAEQSDVRISGVDIGHVITLKLGKDGRTHATLEIASKYAPVRSNMHAILRQKTLLGETYIQLIPEGGAAPPLPDGAQLADSHVEPSVTLDDILSALNPQTRRAFQVWQQSVAVGLVGNGESINADFAELEPFVEQANKLVTILASQEGALRWSTTPASSSPRSQAATTSSKVDRQRRENLPRGRRKQPRVRRSVRSAAGVRAQLAHRAERNRHLRHQHQPVPRSVPPCRAPAGVGDEADEDLRSRLQQLPDSVGAVDEGGEGGSAGCREGAST